MKTNKGKHTYSIGLDIGVGSVGWACMTNDFRLLKYNGKTALGVREFESANTAEETRLKRGARRRYNRRIKRIQLLQETLNPLFVQDENFLNAVNLDKKHYWRNSNHFENNTLSETLHQLGRNKREFPTVYHLRKSLIENKKKEDVRLIYLALHNLVKFRGHFLNEGMNWARKESGNTEIIQLKEIVEAAVNSGSIISEITDESFLVSLAIIGNQDMSKNDKTNELKKHVPKEVIALFKLIIGSKVNLWDAFPDSDNFLMYKNEKLKAELGTEDLDTIVNELTDEEQIVIEKAGDLYQSFLLKELLGESSYVSAAKVLSYNKFGTDMDTLKKLYNTYLGEKEYRAMFITSRKAEKEYKLTRDPKVLCEFDQFLKHKNKYEEKLFNTVRKKITELKKGVGLAARDRKVIDDILFEIEANQFLQKQKGFINASIPHQNNVFEAMSILRNQQEFYPEINEEMINRVEQIISFRIPYYMGPLTMTDDEKFGWASRLQQGVNIKPWNIDEVIDRSQSAENFITRMNSYCTYLPSEKVLPKHSLIYQKFELLNELNGVQIRHATDKPDRKYRLSALEKEWIIDNVFMKYKSVTNTTLLRELKNSEFKDIVIDNDELRNVFGTQKEDKFSTNLSTHIDMHKIFGDLDEVDNIMLEEIIYWISVFNEKDIIQSKINEKYPIVTEVQIKKLVNLNYAGWGRLSHKLLNEIIIGANHTETVLDVMKTEPVVYMELLSMEKYSLEDKIKKINSQSQGDILKIKYSDVKELHGSPALKKGIWQAVLIVEELVEIFGEPENIILEFAREEGIKRRQKSRKELWKETEKAVTSDEKELKQFVKQHKNHEEVEYQNDRFYLYLTQNGKCMYSGESLDISQLHLYEVDHVLPRSFVKDDSLDNLALVKSSINKDKGHTQMPLQIIPTSKKSAIRYQWRKLYENKLISGKKYNRLLKEEFTEQDQEGFFARQLVETRQIIKHVKDLFEERFEDTGIHALKADFITNLRKHTNIYKIRDYNNKHHAVDAALGAVIVNFIIKKHGSNFLKFDFKYEAARKKWNKSIKTYKKNFFLFSEIDKYDKFPGYDTGEILDGRRFLASINDDIPWQTTLKIGNNEGRYYKETIYSPLVKKPNYTSSKLEQGVHVEVTPDSTYLVSYREVGKNGKEKSVSSFISLSLIEKQQNKKMNNNELAMFLAEKVAKGNVVKAIIHTKVLKNQLVLFQGHPYYYVSAQSRNNAKQFRINKEDIQSYMELCWLKENDFIESLKHAKVTFEKISRQAIEQYKAILSEGNIKKIEEYSEKIVDKDAFLTGFSELFRMTSASAARSDKLGFGGRPSKNITPKEALFVYQSVTGLRYRRPKSFKKDLWSK